ncbi:hypothetical protein [Acetobacter estunensis]|uniref:hypothetical protein n=1 Tax=Acetobacter estunensis TaxID=104097 RepID=UPI00140A4551|nr:hypothetical protein [Acetobacter estunensis]
MLSPRDGPDQYMTDGMHAISFQRDIISLRLTWLAARNRLPVRRVAREGSCLVREATHHRKDSP